MTPYISSLLARLEQRYSACPRFLGQVQTALTAYDTAQPLPPMADAPSWWERLCTPVRFVCFSFSWQDDTGTAQVGTGYIVNYVNLSSRRCTVRIHPGLTPDSILAEGFSALLENALAGHTGSCLVGAVGEPWTLSRRGSLCFCQSFIRALGALVRPLPALEGLHVALPKRERGYVLGAYGAMTHSPMETLEPALSHDQAAGYGLAYAAQGLLQRYRRTGLDGKPLLLAGTSPLAAYAAQKAAQLGAHIVAVGDETGFCPTDGLPVSALKALADTPLASLSPDTFTPDPGGLWDIPAAVVLLCPGNCPMDTTRLVSHAPEVVLEGMGVTVDVSAVTALENRGVLISPDILGGVGGALWPRLWPGLSPWEADRQLRTAMGTQISALWDFQNQSPCLAAYGVALERLKTTLLTQGLI
jgi:glutamate dehydrogenase (NADP+)